MDWTAWAGMRNEPELRSLYEWLDTQINYGGGKAGAIVGAVGGFSFAIAMGAGLLLLRAYNTGMRSHPEYLLLPLLGAFAITGGTYLYCYWKTSYSRKELHTKIRESRSFVWKLYSARWTGNVAETIGNESALALNGAAYDYLRCMAALKSPSWRGLSSDSPWVPAREKAEVAMEAAMARLLTMIGHGGNPEVPEVRQLLGDMHQTTDEIVKTAARLAERSGLAGDVSDELQHVLSEMRVLNAAHDEVMEIRNL